VTSDGADVHSKVPRVFVFGVLIGHEPSRGEPPEGRLGWRHVGKIA
jgi:hypothetical protein